MKQAIDPVDADVGARVRAKRLERGLTQEALADSLGVSFQQLQKYEKGINKIKPVHLLVLKKMLGVQLSYFFRTNRNADRNVFPEQDILLALQSDELWLELNRAFFRIKDPSLRRKLLAVIEHIADSEGTDVRFG